jgi:hypothetical protein
VVDEQIRRQIIIYIACPESISFAFLVALDLSANEAAWRAAHCRYVCASEF